MDKYYFRVPSIDASEEEWKDFFRDFLGTGLQFFDLKINEKDVDEFYKELKPKIDAFKAAKHNK